LFNEGNFLQAAAALGVVREVVWVMPFTFLNGDDARERLLAYLRRAGFPETDGATFRLVDGWFRGALGGVPVILCSQERLPPLAEPVLLSIDADFFPHAASYRELSPLAEIRHLFKALGEARYAVRDAVVVYSVQGGFLPVRLRWVADAVVEVLRDPAIARESKPPARWLDLQTVEAVRVKPAPENEGMLALALGYLENRPHDPALLLYAAEASARHGSGDAALAYAEEACRAEAGYCAGLREIGLLLLERGDGEASRKFFEAADRMQPGMAFGQLERGMTLLAAGMVQEALEVFAELRAREGAFPIGFLIGEVQLATGDPAAARRSFDEALAAMEADRHAGVPNDVVAEAIRRAGAFYRTEGLARQAQAIENDPRSRWSYDGQDP
jgi:tetratricopeptide (TPR) repeat protein